tara:strand:+ start:1131 stop:2180 length:1050 start_codon:yes stop_codon:yes gene_type:complete
MIKVKTIKEYNKSPTESISNSYDTKPNAFSEPGIKILVGVRGTGKSYTASKIMLQAVKDKTFDNFIFITPTFESNSGHYKQFNILPENVIYPSKTAIDEVIEKIEQDRDDFENYLVEMEIYKRFKRDSKNKKNISLITTDNLNDYMDYGYINENGMINRDIVKPEWKYKIIRPPQTLLLVDDCLGSSVLSQTDSFTKLMIMNRHIAPMSQAYGNRQALGCSVMLLVQSYTARNGIPRSCRENCTDLILFTNKSKDQMKKIKDELAGAIDENNFQIACDYALKEKHDNLSITFNPKCPTKTFRKNLSSFIVFGEDLKHCNCDGKMRKVLVKQPKDKDEKEDEKEDENINK